MQKKPSFDVFMIQRFKNPKTQMKKFKPFAKQTGKLFLFGSWDLWLLGSLALGIFAYLLIPPATFAQSKNTIVVTPQLLQLDLSEDAPEAVYTYTNNTTQTIELSLSMQDVKDLEDRGVPGILDAAEGANYKYGLSSWARFSNTNLVIGPGESKTVTVFIDKTRLTLGGHYATVLAELQQKEAGENVKLRAVLSSLLFVRSGSEYEQENASITHLETDSKFFLFPTSVSFDFGNSGNVELTPYGTVSVIDPFGKLVAKGIVNEDSLITLPDVTRKYNSKLMQLTNLRTPGFYKAIVDVRYGKHNFKTQKEVVFLSLGVIKGEILLSLIALPIILLIVVLNLKSRLGKSKKT